MPEAAGLFYFEHFGGDPDGESPPLVFVHGAGGNHLHWPPQIRRLPDQTVYSVDLPGHANSEGSGHSRIEDYVNSIDAWMAALDLSKIILGGHSMGGAITLQFALQSPEKLLGLILFGTGGRLRVSPLILDSTADPALFEEAVDLIIEWSFSANAPEQLVELAKRRMLEVDHNVIHHDFIACDNFDVIDRLNEIDIPALVVCGEDDRLTPMKYSEFLLDKLESAHLTRVPDAGHMVMLEQPEEVASVVADFATQIE